MGKPTFDLLYCVVMALRGAIDAVVLVIHYNWSHEGIMP